MLLIFLCRCFMQLRSSYCRQRKLILLMHHSPRRTQQLKSVVEEEPIKKARRDVVNFFHVFLQNNICVFVCIESMQMDHCYKFQCHLVNSRCLVSSCTIFMILLYYLNKCGIKWKANCIVYGVLCINWLYGKWVKNKG